MVEFYDTSALMTDTNKITSDIIISEVSVQELENFVWTGNEEAACRARDALYRIKTFEPTVILLEDAIKWYQLYMGTDEAVYDLDRLINRDFLSVILTAFYVKNIYEDPNFIFHTDSYLSFVNAKSLYFDLPVENKNRGEKS